MTAFARSWQAYKESTPHPVAVTIARATYVLALGKLVVAARRPIQIPVYLADVLFLPREVEKNLIEQLRGIEITFGPRKNQRKYVLPDMMVHQPENLDDCMVAATRIAEDHAAHGRESLGSLDSFLHQAVPDLSQILQREEIVQALWIRRRPERTDPAEAKLNLVFHHPQQLSAGHAATAV